MMLKRILLPAVVTITLLVSAAFADEAPQQPIKTPESGWYGKAGFGASAAGFLFDGGGPFSYTQLVGLGYQFNRHFALGLDSLFLFRSYGVAIPVELYAKGIIPLSDRWNIYGKFGLGAGPYKAYHPENELKTGFLNGIVFVSVGLGVNYQLTHALAAGVEVSGYYGLLAGAANATANLTYYFGA